MLAGKTLDESSAKAAADAAFAQAKPREHNAFKIELGKRTLSARYYRPPHWRSDMNRAAPGAERQYGPAGAAH